MTVRSLARKDKKQEADNGSFEGGDKQLQLVSTVMGEPA